MSQEEHNYMLRLVRGEEPFLKGDPPRLDVTANIYFQLAVLNDELRPRLKAEIGLGFDDLIRERLRALIPLLIEQFRSAEMLAAIENELTLIVRGCELFELDVDEFIRRQELLPLARTAYVRSAKAFKQLLGLKQPSQLFFALAAGIGITAEEMELEPEFVERCIDQQLYRGNSNPLLASLWNYHVENRRYLEEALA